MKTPAKSELGKRRSLKLKLVGPIAVLGSLCALSLGIVLANVGREMVSREVVKHAKSVAHAVVCTTECTSDVDDLRRIVNAMAAEEGVESILVVGGDPLRVVAGNRAVLVGKTPDELSDDFRKDVMMSIRSGREEILPHDDGSAMAYAIPVTASFDEKKYSNGAVVVHVDTAAVTSSIDGWTVRLGIWLFVAISVLVVLSAALIGKFVILPLRIVESAASATDHSERIARLPNDEIGDLGRRLELAQVASAHATRTLVVAKDAADDASRAKSEFLATMSHELRTPLNGILGFADLLVDAPLGPEDRESVETIRNSANALLVILNDILDFSKIEAGKMSVESTHFDACRATREVVRLLSAQAAEKGVVVGCDWTSDAPVCVVGDPLRLRQVLLNLVGNAVKFTESGSVSIRACAIADRVRFEIVDTGIGISQETLTRLFAKFTQADSSTTRRFGGTGLGLAISKNLVELMGGRIGAESVPGRGSTFWFELPVGNCDAVDGEELPKESRESERRFDGCRVLLAEDNAVNQKLAVRVLETLGCVVDTANDGVAAVELAKKSGYDVILMDCLMPEMDGFSASEAIRRLEKDLGKDAVPIIALTANAQTADREACRASGMDDFLSKPFRRKDLVQALDRNLS